MKRDEKNSEQTDVKSNTFGTFPSDTKADPVAPVANIAADTRTKCDENWDRPFTDEELEQLENEKPENDSDEDEDYSSSSDDEPPSSSKRKLHPKHPANRSLTVMPPKPITPLKPLQLPIGIKPMRPLAAMVPAQPAMDPKVHTELRTTFSHNPIVLQALGISTGLMSERLRVMRDGK